MFVFSRAEREYLRQVTAGPEAGTQRRLEASFPNPAYRRKLRWGIRHKAERALADCRLYAEAARRQQALVPRGPDTSDGTPPLYTDPIVVLLGALRRRFPRRGRVKDSRDAPGPRIGGKRVVGLLFWTGVAAAVALGIALVIWGLMLRRGFRLGTRGAVQRSRLTCSKCGQVFDYDWIPGGSFTSVRLGPGRYMSCPLCHRWSYFDLYGSMVVRPPPPS